LQPLQAKQPKNGAKYYFFLYPLKRQLNHFPDQLISVEMFYQQLSVVVFPSFAANK